jgi:hypothetical protein
LLPLKGIRVKLLNGFQCLIEIQDRCQAMAWHGTFPASAATPGRDHSGTVKGKADAEIVCYNSHLFGRFSFCWPASPLVFITGMAGARHLLWPQRIMKRLCLQCFGERFL